MGTCAHDHSLSVRVITRSSEQTQALAERLGRSLRAGDVVALTGPLGSGKTCFVQGLARGLRVVGQVASPTFIMMRLHRGELPLCHVDAYRMDGPGDLIDLGLDDWWAQAVVAVEWADRVLAALPAERIDVRLAYHPQGREVQLVGRGKRAGELLSQLRDHDTGY